MEYHQFRGILQDGIRGLKDRDPYISGLIDDLWYDIKDKENLSEEDVENIQKAIKVGRNLERITLGEDNSITVSISGAAITISHLNIGDELVLRGSLEYVNSVQSKPWRLDTLRRNGPEVIELIRRTESELNYKGTPYRVINKKSNPKDYEEEDRRLKLYKKR